MNAELIAVGTEILLGDIVNTDAQLISQGLSELGINVFYQTVVGDNPARLERVVREAKDRADIIITTGGLGPTLDDLTKETLATVFGKKMVLHQPSMDRLTDFFKTIGREMTKNNEKQAWLPEGCTVFTNLWGTAPGCAFEADGKHVLMLPGPPRECNPMWKECAMPYLYKLAGGCIVSRNIRVFGLGESNMENILHDMMEKSANPTIAPYARTSECFARVTAKADTPAECEKLLDPVVDEILKLLGDDVYGVDVDSLEQVVGDGLRERKLTLAVAESCTGGLLSKRLTDIPGASDYYLGGVCSYSNSVKEKVLGVKKETLDTVGAVSPKPQSRWLSALQMRLARTSASASPALPARAAVPRTSRPVWSISAFGTTASSLPVKCSPRSAATVCACRPLLRRLISSAVTFSKQIYIELYVILSFPLK